MKVQEHVLLAPHARDMHDAVEQIFGMHLEREVEYVGDAAPDA